MLVYLNNFPREDATKGQKFKGDKALEDELLGRKIIGEGEELVIEVDKETSLSEKIKTLTEAEATLKAEITKLEAQLKNKKA